MREHRHQVDTSVGVSGPHDFAVRAGRIRLVRRRVHRIPLPTFVTTAKRPSFQARDGRKNAGDLPDIATKNACGRLARRANHFIPESRAAPDRNPFVKITGVEKPAAWPSLKFAK
jgi:hypothetical protein